MTDVDGISRPDLRRADLRRMGDALDQPKPATS